MRSMVEGAQTVRKILWRQEKFCDVESSVNANAPPTAQTRGPPSPLSWGGMKRPVVTEKGEFL